MVSVGQKQQNAISEKIIKDPQYNVQTPLKQTYEAGLKSISSETLFEAMKGKPKPDRMIFGLIRYPRSEDYKQVVHHLDDFRNKFAQLADRPLGQLRKAEITELKNILTTAKAWANEYMITHWGQKDTNPAKNSRVIAMNDLKLTLDHQMGNLDKMLTLKGTFDPKVTIGDAMVIFSSGVTKHEVITTNTDKKLEEKKVLGSGEVNTVSLATFKNSEGDKETRVMKPITATVKYMGDFGSTNPNRKSDGGYAGFRLDNPKIAERNIASGNVANLLNVGHMLPTPKLSLFEGSVCLDMPLAKGDPGQKETRVKCSEVMLEKIKVCENAIQEAISEGRDKQFIRNRRNDLQSLFNNNKITKGQNGYEIDVMKPITLPFTSEQPNELTANLQKALMDLQVLDCLCGQLDRHLGNYFIAVEGTEVNITAIDNDGSFGEADVPVNRLTDDTDSYHYHGMPPVMTRFMANQLEGLSEQDLQLALESAGLEDPEIKLALIRLTALKEHAQDLDSKGLVTDDFMGFRLLDMEGETSQSMSEFLNQFHDNHSNYLNKAVMTQQLYVNNGYSLN